MRNGFLASAGSLLACTTLALGQYMPKTEPATTNDPYWNTYAPTSLTGGSHGGPGVAAGQSAPATQPAKPTAQPAPVGPKAAYVWPYAPAAKTKAQRAAAPVVKAAYAEPKGKPAAAVMGINHEEMVEDCAAPCEPAPPCEPARPCCPPPQPCCCCPPPFFWVSGEYLFWWIEDGGLETALLTVGTPTGLGIIGEPGTQVLFGGNGLNYSNPVNGARFSAGLTVPESRIGIEASGFFLEQRSVDFGALSDATGNPVFLRPAFDAVADQEAGLLVSYPGLYAGGLTVFSSNRLWGAEANGVRSLWDGRMVSIDFLGGFRYLDLDEDLTIQQSTFALDGAAVGFNGNLLTTPNFANLSDSFRTENQFYGGQLGARVEFRYARVYVCATGKVALGNSHEELTINGETTVSGLGLEPVTARGGLLATASNIGRYTCDHFAVVPEATVNLGYTITNNLRAYVGYTFLYWNNVMRPGDQVSRNINPNLVQASGLFGGGDQPFVPQPTFKQVDFWAQGLNFGFALRF